MSTCEILPFGLGDGANVKSAAAWLASAARQTGFQAGAASSQDFNTAWRQSAFVAAMIANFTSQQSGNDVLDDGNLAGLLQNYETALQEFIQKTGINIGGVPPAYPADGCLWINTGTTTYTALNDKIPPGGLACFYGLAGWHYIGGGERGFFGTTAVSQSFPQAQDTLCNVSGINPPWGHWQAGQGLVIDVAGDYAFHFYAQIQVSWSAIQSNGLSSMIKKGATRVAVQETLGFQDTGYVYAQTCTHFDTCAVGDIISPVIYPFGPYVTSAVSLDQTTFRAFRIG
jgi:hypothetical protein